MIENVMRKHRLSKDMVAAILTANQSAQFGVAAVAADRRTTNALHDRHLVIGIPVKGTRTQVTFYLNDRGRGVLCEILEAQEALV